MPGKNRKAQKKFYRLFTNSRSLPRGDVDDIVREIEV
jgi:hypothetical protein